MEIVPQGLQEEKAREVTEEKMTLRRAWRSESWTCIMTQKPGQEGTRPTLKMPPTQSIHRTRAGASYRRIMSACASFA